MRCLFLPAVAILTTQCSFDTRSRCAPFSPCFVSTVSGFSQEVFSRGSCWEWRGGERLESPTRRCYVCHRRRPAVRSRRFLCFGDCYATHCSLPFLLIPPKVCGHIRNAADFFLTSFMTLIPYVFRVMVPVLSLKKVWGMCRPRCHGM